MSEDMAREVSERYLKEMLEADDAADFELYTKRFERQYLKDFTRERFDNDIKAMHKRNGSHQSYEFLSTLRPVKFEDVEVYRTVWKGIYEKRDAVIEFGVYERAGVWYVIQSEVH